MHFISAVHKMEAVNFWQTIWKVLIDEAGASEYDDMGFSSLAGDFTEWRFRGKLGFGGKVWHASFSHKVYISCYPEDRTPERIEIIERVNIILQELYDNHYNIDPI